MLQDAEQSNQVEKPGGVGGLHKILGGLSTCLFFFVCFFKLPLVTGPQVLPQSLLLQHCPQL